MNGRDVIPKEGERKKERKKEQQQLQHIQGQVINMLTHLSIMQQQQDNQEQ